MTHPRTLLATIKKEFSGESLHGQLMRSAMGLSGLKILSLALAFLASMVYARALGVHNYGLYAYVIAWTSALTIPASLGFPQYILLQLSKEPRETRGMLEWSQPWVFATGILIGSAMVACALLPGLAEIKTLFLLAAPIPLLTNLAALNQSLVQAHGRVVQGQWPTVVLAPSLILTGAIMLWVTSGHINPAGLMALTACSTAVALAVNRRQVSRYLGNCLDSLQNPRKLRQALPFMWLGTLFLINSRVDLIILGTIRGGTEAGTYAIATRAAELVGLFLLASNSAIAPTIAKLHHNRNTAALQKLITTTSLRTLVLSLPIAALFLCFPHRLLDFFFGTSFAAAATPLRILTLGQLFNVAAGPTGTLLNMTDNARLSTFGLAVSALTNVVLCLVLVPHFGAIGASVATTSSLVLWNIILWHWIRRMIKIKPSALRM